MKFEEFLNFTLIYILALCGIGSAIQCYQCDSLEDHSCPSYQLFDRNLNALVDCNSFEARVPGVFCMKITQQSPGWFGWTKITRRCGSRSDTGVAWGCQWTYQDNGVFKEVCYCEDRDGCNAALKHVTNIYVLTFALITLSLMKIFYL